MRTAFWSLAALAGVAFATPDGWGNGWGGSASSSASSATTSVVVSSSHASSSTSAVSSKSSSVPAAVSSSKVSSEASTSSESSSVSKEHSTHYSTVTVPETITVHTTVYTTVGTETVTKTSGGKTYTTTIVSTHTGTSTVTSTIKASKHVSSASKPVSSASKHHSSHSKPLSSPVGPVATSSTSELHTGAVTTSPSSGVTVWKTVKTTTTVCPVAPTCAVSAAGALTTVTHVAYTYTTVCPVTATRTDGSSTYTKTFDVTSTITTTTAATITLLPSGGPSTVIVTPVPASSSESASASKHGHGHGHHSKHASKLSSLISAESSASHESASKDKASKTHSEHKSKSTAASSASKASLAPVSSAKVSVAAVSSSSKIAVTTISSSSSAKASSTSSTSPAWPTRAVGPNPYDSDCVPCKGQPGDDPETFCGMTVETDSYDPANIPITCKHKTFDLFLQNVTVSPDGQSRYGLVINGSFPGPLIEANWGDWISITLHNELTNNGTSLHMHGLRQYYTNEMDGVASITQCPIAPGESFTYTFRADNYGTSWYHSHFSLQTYEGFLGPVTIHGPKHVEYDFEENIVLSDWNHIPVDQMWDAAQWNGPRPPASGPRTLDTGLINGQNVWLAPHTDEYISGNYFELKVETGKKYRLRLVSASLQAMWKFSVDNHILTVIAADFVPIEPYTVEYLNVNIGQRYDVILEANQAPDNYWMRSINQQSCNNITQWEVQGIVRYNSDSKANPTTTGYAYKDGCIDEPLASLVPVLKLNAGDMTNNVTEDIGILPSDADALGIAQPNTFVVPGGIYRWTLSGSFFQAKYEDPTLPAIVDSQKPPTDSIVVNATIGDWVYLIIDTSMAGFGPPGGPVQNITHPIHLHGHDFFVLAQGYGPWHDGMPMNLINPPRRDVAMMPGDNSGGHIVLAYKADNPGAWLVHCHIGWHNAMGFALQIIEGQELISSTIADKPQIDGTCAAWNKYKNADMVLDAGV